MSAIGRGPEHARVRSRHARAWLAAVAVLTLAVALARVADLPTGSPSVSGLVPGGARLAASADVGDVHVLLTVASDRLVARVAYRGPKGWQGMEAGSAPLTAPAVRTVTAGHGPIPALSAVFGRMSGSTVEVRWADGSLDRVHPEVDGSYLVAREGRVGVQWVRASDGSGKTSLEVRDL